MSALSYRPDIDGLRTVAVLPVVLGHAGVPGFAGGYVGVDIFFVISGFLITGILWRELEQDRYSIIGFFERRARRILPALFAVLAVCLGVGATMLPPDLLLGLGRSVAAALLFVSNLWFWRATSDYFAPEAELEPLLHTWSLAVEEQFYIVFPILLWALYRWARGWLVPVIAGIAVMSFALSAWMTGPYPQANFYLAPTRAWELGLGALLALGVFPGSRSRVVLEVVATASLAAIAAAILLYDAATPFPGVAAALPCLGALGLIWAGAQGRTLAGRLLSSPPFVWIGLISYSLYLWHWPILVFFRLRTGSLELHAPTIVLAVALSVAFAWTSWRFVEAPFRSRPPVGLSRGAIFGGSMAGMAALLIVSAGVEATRGLPIRIPADIRSIYAVSREVNHCPNPLKKGICPLGKEGARDVLLWGDSHAEAALPGVDLALARAGLGGGVVSKGACPPLLGVERIDMGAGHGCASHNRDVLERLRATDDYPTVMLLARWALAAEGVRAEGEGGRPAILQSETGQGGRVADNHAVFDAGLEALVAALRDTGRRVVIIDGVPEVGWNVPLTLGNSLLLGAPIPAPPSADEVAARNVRANATIARLAELPGVERVRLAPAFCAPLCIVARDGRPIYRDEDHLSRYGA